MRMRSSARIRRLKGCRGALTAPAGSLGFLERITLTCYGYCSKLSIITVSVDDAPWLGHSIVLSVRQHPVNSPPFPLANCHTVHAVPWAKQMILAVHQCRYLPCRVL